MASICFGILLQNLFQLISMLPSDVCIWIPLTISEYFSRSLQSWRHSHFGSSCASSMTLYLTGIRRVVWISPPYKDLQVDLYNYHYPSLFILLPGLLSQKGMFCFPFS